MSTDTVRSLPPESPDWQEFETSLAEIAALAKSDLGRTEFAAGLLERMLQLLAADGGAIWLNDGEGELQLEADLRLDSLFSQNTSLTASSHRKLLHRVLRGGELVVLPPGCSIDGASPDVFNTNSLLIFAPLQIDDDVVGLIEVIQRPTSDAAALRGHRRLISMISELAADYLRRREIRRLRQAQIASQQLEQFLQKAHSTLDLRATGYLLANEGRRFLGCDRVSVAIRRGKRFRLLATSGVDSINRRSNTVRRMEQLIASMAVLGRPFFYAGDTSDLPPQLEERVQRYIDQSHPTALAIVPMQIASGEGEVENGAIVGVLVAEQFDGPLGDATQQRILKTASQSALALKNAIAFQALPTLPFARRRARALTACRPSRRGAAWAVAILTCCCAIAALVLVRVDFNIAVQGELQPQRRRDVFAPVDGEIIELVVAHGDQVSTGEELLVLRSPKIELELQRVEGEYETARKRLLAVESALLQFDPNEQRMSSQQSRLAGELAEIKQQLLSQRAQRQLLLQEREKLRVRGPIDGQVLTWNLHQRLEDRPVGRGQSLLVVADVAGPWIAELSIPDDRIGLVMAAEKELGTPPRVSLELATNRALIYEGRIQQLATRTELDANDAPVVRAIVELGAGVVPAGARPGSTVFAKIHCGRESVGYVWLHDLLHAIRHWTLF